MRKYTVLNPTFKDEIIITETGDPGHADNINSGPKQIFQNTLVNNKEIKEGDSQNRTVTFTSNDSTDAKSWTNVAVMESGENHKSLFEKISTMFKNVRFLYKLLGTTDISVIKDGTVTGILNALDHVAFSGIYSDLHNKPLALPASDVYTWAKQATKPAYTKSEVGLGNVNNTSDQNKPVSTAQQTALDKKVNFTDITRSTAVNIAGKKALDAVEKNPSVEGTMAHDISQIYSNLQSRFGNLIFAAIEIGSMPTTTDIPLYYDFPDGFNSNNTFVVAVRVVRDRGVYVYSNDGKACNIIFDNGRISVYATEYGITYCSGAPMSCLLAKI